MKRKNFLIFLGQKARQIELGFSNKGRGNGIDCICWHMERERFLGHLFDQKSLDFFDTR